jgi:hypothetical protein
VERVVPRHAVALAKATQRVGKKAALPPEFAPSVNNLHIAFGEADPPFTHIPHAAENSKKSFFASTANA